MSTAGLIPVENLERTIFMLSNQRKELKKVSLHAQLEFLTSLRSRYFVWANDADDPEITRLHLEILDLIRHLRDKLLDIYV